jgi:hypothetical protein
MLRSNLVALPVVVLAAVGGFVFARNPGVGPGDDSCS